MGVILNTVVEYHEEHLKLPGVNIQLPKKIITKIELHNKSAISGGIKSNYCFVVTEIDHKSAFFGTTKDMCSIKIYPENNNQPYHKTIDNHEDFSVEDRDKINDLWEAITLHVDDCETLARH
ncbi:MAG: hypothetical protein ABIC91_03020 [Nanoarchaeota archaeon]|nr:hypothetical protein [Nanoarchaeota archaeon]MBU1030101.1 hypothetical protein [Nanoarchaeota archaeon]MBU1849937.1 hypothetical protein [Nanoarchaeota archaeon]